MGKAKNLKKRVSSYAQLGRLGNRIRQLSQTAHQLKFQVLDSELEALLVEAELIRTHQPKYNILLKDDKTPLYIHITNETFPRILTARKKEIITRKLDGKGVILGPFPSSNKVKEVLKLVRPIFRWCQNPPKNDQTKSPKKSLKPCFYHHIDLCSGACVGETSPQEYKQEIKNLTLFLQGKRKSVLQTLKKEMKVLAEQEKFEQAQERKKQIELIQEVTEKRLKPNLTLPQLQLTQTEEALTQLKQFLVDYAGIPQSWSLTTIEGYDVSNIQGTNPTVSLVTFTDGQPNKSKYKLFNIRSLQTPNDYQMMKEALTRRQKHPEWGIPNLIVADGGKGQVRSIMSVWKWPTPVIGLVKNPDRIVIPIVEKKVQKSPNSSQPKELPITYKITDYHLIKLEANHPTLKLLQQIRDESHRFAQRQHKKMRIKSMLGE